MKNKTIYFSLGLFCGLFIWFVASRVITYYSEKEDNELHIFHKKGINMKIKLSSIFVDDQDKALKFYTEILGFVKKEDIPMGEYRWLTVVSPEGPDDLELVLEPNANSAAATYQKAIFEQGIPATSFASDNVQEEFKKLKELGVEFKMEPTKAGDVILAIFNDTCGNYIQLHQE